MMKNNNNENMKDNLQELSLEDMENVAGGGIKQVVAATTLAAMAMTGNTVSAFGLANALAEGSAHVETTPEQENNGGAFEGVTVESIEEGNGDEDGGTDAVAATDAGSADEVVVMDAEETIMEVEDALFGEEEAPLNEAGEAVDLTIPYLTGQLTIFEEACVTLNAVYDAREAVYGAGSVSESREKMSLRLSGLDRNGNKVQNSVFECFSEYLGKDRFIFVNRSNNTNIKLNTNLLVYENFGALCTLTAISDKRNDWTLPYFVGQTPLSTDQVESLADYCKQRNITIWDFLVHDMGFGIQKIRPTDTNFREVGDLEEARVRNPSEAERQAQQITGIKYTPNIYITGAQKTGKLERKTVNTGLSKYKDYWVKMNVVNACVKGAGNENKLLRYFRTNTNTSNPTNKIYDIHLLMFQSR